MNAVIKILVLVSLFSALAWSYQLQLMYAKVHEAITKRAAEIAGISYSKNLEKGIRWNDMPCNSNVNNAKVELCSWRVVTDIDKPGTITYDSHNGKFSFWHSMAPPGRHSNQELVEKILKQMRFWYELAVRERSVFVIGKCLHMIQDSYSRAHVARDRQYRIEFFQFYPLQDADKHANLEGGAICKRQHWSSLYGTKHAVEGSAQMLRFFKERAPWSRVESYLRRVVYALSPGASNSVAGGTIPEIAKKGVQGRSFYKEIQSTSLVKNLKAIVQMKHTLKKELKVVKKFDKRLEQTKPKPKPVYRHPVYSKRPRWYYDHRKRKFVFGTTSTLFFKKLGKKIKSAFSKAKDKIVKFYHKAEGKIKRFIKIASGLAKETFKKLGKMACRFLKDAGYAIKEAAEKLGKKIKSAGKKVAKKAVNVTKQIRNKTKTFVQNFKNRLPSKVREKAKSFVKKLKRL